jgi:L-lactate dehydrogenase (cytochrome)
MDRGAYGYIAGSAGAESTARANRAAFERWRIVPRMLRDVSVRDVSVELFGSRLPSPLLLAPIGVLTIAHPEGEPAVARAAASEGVPLVLSSAAAHSIEQVASASGSGPRWFQLYWSKDRDVVASFLHRARTAGYTALVVTLDTHTLGWRPRDLDQAYLPFLRGVGIANYRSDPAFQKAAGDDEILHWAATFGDPSLTWDDLSFLRDHWTGPILLKGIQHPDDARRAVDEGMDGVIVSNHGGRQVDGAIASLDALPAVVEAVGSRTTVLFDSGVRTGTDVIKALALGARAVLVARPYAYGLALAGEDGVRHVIRCLQAELDIALGLSGVARVADLTPDLLVRP